MKKKIRETGEIIDVVSYSGGCSRYEYDTVSFIDSNGNERSEPLNYYWDLEDIDIVPSEEQYWEHFRNDAALKIFAAKLSQGLSKKDVTDEISLSVHYANHLVKELMKNKLKIEEEK